LGILSHPGELRKSGAIALTDFDFAASRGRSYGHEALKSLLDVPEGGCIKDTRWRPATIPKDKPRLLALNGDIECCGAWFRKYEQCAIATMIDYISAATEPDINPTERARRWAAAAIQMKRLDSDEQAAARRVAIGIARDKLVTEDTVAALRKDTTSKARNGIARRKAYWAAKQR
jgi:hypothetical protein